MPGRKRVKEGRRGRNAFGDSVLDAARFSGGSRPVAAQVVMVRPHQETDFEPQQDGSEFFTRHRRSPFPIHWASTFHAKAKFFGNG